MLAWLKRWWWALSLAVLGLGVAALFFMRAPRVETVLAQRGEIVQTVVASGRVLPAARVELAALSLGRVVEVQRREGARVHAGDVLARLDDAQALVDLARAEAAAAVARARLARVRGPSALSAAEALGRAESDAATARADLSRLEAVVSAGGATAQEVARARALLDTRESARETARIALVETRGVDGREAAATLAQAEADVSSARIRLANLTVLAPAEGALMSCAIEPGDVVAAGQQLFELAVDGPTRVRIDPDESTLSLLAEGQPALVSPEAFPELRLAARVSYIGPAVDPLRGTIEVRLEVPSPPEVLRADMTASVDIEVARRPDALVLPAGAVRGVGTSTPWVLVVEADHAVRRDVRVGAIGEEAIEIREGIEVGAHVIPSSVLAIAEGARVRLAAE